jgi:cell division protein FtsL
MAVAAPPRSARTRRGEATARPQPARPRSARHARRLSPGAAAAIAVLVVVAAGIVATEAAVSQQNMERGRLQAQAQRLANDNRNLQAQIDEATSAPRIAERAQQLGMFKVPPALVHYLRHG